MARQMKKLAGFRPYDFDTMLGINNEGELGFSYDLEDTDKVDGADVYNGQQSVLWKLIRLAYPAELKAMFQSLRSTGAWSYPKFEAEFEAHQGKWPEAVFDEDAWFKYIKPLLDPENGESPTDEYLKMCQGSKAEQRKWWLYNRFRYLDSKYNAGDAQSDTIVLRGYAASNITVTPYASIYPAVKYGSYLVTARGTRNQSMTLECPLESLNDTEIAIYSASQLASVGDLSGLKVGYASFANGTSLTSIKVGDSGSGYSNPNLTTLYVGSNDVLQSVDARNCPNLVNPVNLSGCPDLVEAYFDGTSVTGVMLPDGGMLETLHLPATVTNLDVRNQKKVEDFTMPSYAGIESLWLENVSEEFDPLTIMAAMPDNARVRLVGFGWEYQSVAAAQSGLYDVLNRFKGMDEFGDNTDKAQVIDCYVHVPSATGDQIDALKAQYPYLDVRADHTETTRSFYNYDGTTLIGTVTCLDGVAQSAAPNVPARSSTAQYDFTAVGWSTSQDSATADYNHSALTNANVSYYAAYSRAVRSYTISFVKAQDDGGGTLQTRTLEYGTMAAYTGETPTTTKGSATDYPFEGWTPALATVTGAATYTAKFGSPVEVAEITDSWDTILLKISNGTYKNAYKVGNYKPLDLGEYGTYNMQIAAFDEDVDANNQTVPVSFVSMELIDPEVIPNSIRADFRISPARKGGSSNSATDPYDYSDSNARDALTDYFLPKMSTSLSSLYSHLVAAKKTYRYVGAGHVGDWNYHGQQGTITDKLWVPSIRELGLSAQYDYSESSGAAYRKLYSENSRRIKTLNGTASGYASRTILLTNSAVAVAGSSSAGQLSTTGTGNSGIDISRIPFGFCLGAAS